MVKTIEDYHVRDEDAPLDKLKPNPKNPRMHPQNLLDSLEKSITTFGKVTPIIVDEDYNVIAGHARLKVALKLGMATFPVRVFKFTPQLAELFMIADNRLSELSEWEMTLLEKDILELKDLNMDIASTGFSEKDIENLLVGVDFGSPDFDMDETAQDERKGRRVRCPQCGEVFEVNRETRV